MKTRFKLCLAACALGAVSLSAQAQVSDDVVKIGVLGDQSGMMADLSGKFGVEAVKMADVYKRQALHRDHHDPRHGARR